MDERRASFPQNRDPSSVREENVDLYVRIKDARETVIPHQRSR